jgi:hypothetical protein
LPGSDVNRENRTVGLLAGRKFYCYLLTRHLLFVDVDKKLIQWSQKSIYVSVIAKGFEGAVPDSV